MRQEAAALWGAGRLVSRARAPGSRSGLCRAASPLLAWPLIEHAQFQELIPSQDIPSSEGAECLHLDLRFAHPTEHGQVMDIDLGTGPGHALSPDGPHS